MRPLPAGARTVTLDEVRYGAVQYDCVINHNITDLLDTKFLDAPKLLVLHDTLEGRMAQQDADFDARDMRAVLNTYLASVGGHAVAISRSSSGMAWSCSSTRSTARPRLRSASTVSTPI